MSKRIKIQLIGSLADKKDVRLEDFIDQMKRVKDALNEAEMAITGLDAPTIDYKVVDLRHDSPSTVVLEPTALNGQPPIISLNEAPEYLANELRSIRKDAKLIAEPDLDRLYAYQRIGVPTRPRKNSHLKEVRIQFARKEVTIDKRFKENLEAIVGPDEESEGSISGRLEAINLHNTNRFTLYPAIGPQRVTGTFPAHLRPQVKRAIDSFVTVSGRLQFKAWSDLPHAITASEIDIHEPDQNLPTLTDLRGVFGTKMGGVTSAEYVDQLRKNEVW